MNIVIASSNKGKIKEIQAILDMANVRAYSDFKENIEIIEDGISFEENAIIKAKAVWEYLKGENIDYVLADDSGLIVPSFDGEPGIYSARYAGENASDEDNNKKIIESLNKQNLKEAKAHYFSAICLFDGKEKHISEGYLHGKIINHCVGNNGFGYDPLFIPDKMDKTLGEVSLDVKKTISHRLEALNKIRDFLK